MKKAILVLTLLFVTIISNAQLGLPSLPFECKQFKVMFSSLNKQLFKNENPIIRLNLKNKNGIEYSLYVSDGTKYVNQIIVQNVSNKTDLFVVSREGKVKPKKNSNTKKFNKNITPVLRLFYQITKNETGLS